MAVANVPVIRLGAPMPTEQISKLRSIMARSPQALRGLVRSPTSPRRAEHRGHFHHRVAIRGPPYMGTRHSTYRLLTFAVLGSWRTLVNIGISVVIFSPGQP